MPANTTSTHWIDRIADDLLRTGTTHLISTGITPSGDYHVGHLREVLIAEGVYRALRERGADVRLNYIADNMDPLRRVYDFLDTDRYAVEVGKPLCDIPCPCGEHSSYADHYLEPFLAALDRLDVRAEVLRADVLYRTGSLDRQIITALEGTDRIREILSEETGRRLPAGWSPLDAQCDACGKLTGTQVTAFDAAVGTVSYQCVCGHSGKSAVGRAGKLTWRVDWPARWQALGVTVEPFGKDHASRGGSYDTGKRILDEIFRRTDAPYAIPYEWVSLQGKGDMSSSKGNLVTLFDLTGAVPPDVVRYMIFRARPMRRIVFDPGLPLLNLVDEYDDTTSRGRDPRAADLARLVDTPPPDVPFRHLVTLVQISDGSAQAVRKVLERNQLEMPDADVLQSRLEYARYWLDNFSPEEMRLQLHDELPPGIDLSEPERTALGQLGGSVKPEMTGDEIHALIYEIATELGLDGKGLFRAIYGVFLGQPRGPRAGWFLSSLDTSFVRKRLLDAAKAS